VETEGRAVTAAMLLQRPDDGHRYELVRGQLRETPPQTRQQGVVAARIALSLLEHVSAHGLGEVFSASTGFQLAPNHVRGCDVAFVSRDRVLAAGQVDGFWPGAPDLAVEVISPTDTSVATEEKVMDWLDAGVRLVIVANPVGRRLTLYRASNEARIVAEGDTLDAGDVVPGWHLTAEQLFAA